MGLLSQVKPPTCWIFGVFFPHLRTKKTRKVKTHSSFFQIITFASLFIASDRLALNDHSRRFVAWRELATENGGGLQQPEHYRNINGKCERKERKRRKKRAPLSCTTFVETCNRLHGVQADKFQSWQLRLRPECNNKRRRSRITKTARSVWIPMTGPGILKVSLAVAANSRSLRRPAASKANQAVRDRF